MDFGGALFYHPRHASIIFLSYVSVNLYNFLTNKSLNFIETILSKMYIFCLYNERYWDFPLPPDYCYYVEKLLIYLYGHIFNSFTELFYEFS